MDIVSCDNLHIYGVRSLASRIVPPCDVVYFASLRHATVVNAHDRYPAFLFCFYTEAADFFFMSLVLQETVVSGGAYSASQGGRTSLRGCFEVRTVNIDDLVVPPRRRYSKRERSSQHDLTDYFSLRALFV